MAIRSILVAGLLVGAVVAAEPEAEQAPHWAYQPLNTSMPAGLPDPGRTRNPIDHFVARRLESLRIAPAPVADRSTLIRRVTLDLTGLRFVSGIDYQFPSSTLAPGARALIAGWEPAFIERYGSDRYQLL